MTRKDGRANDQMRPAAIERGYAKLAAGSALISACIIFSSCSSENVKPVAREDVSESEHSISIANEADSKKVSHTMDYLIGIEKELDESAYISQDISDIVSELNRLSLIDPQSIKGEWLDETMADHISDLYLYHQADPKTAETLVRYLCDPSLRIGGHHIRNAIIRLGMSSVPFLIDYIDSENTAMWEIVELLEIISNNEPALMGDVLKYAAIPKVETELSKPGEGSKFLKAHFSGHYTRLKELSLQLEESR